MTQRNIWRHKNCSFQAKTGI